MLVLIGPDFEGTGDAYARLARVTGLVPYDLKARIRPGAWGVIKVLGDEFQANLLATELTSAGFRPILVPREVAHDAERKIVHAKGLTLEPAGFTLHFTERDMPIEYGAVSCVVRGEVQPGRAAPRAAGSASSGSLRAVTPTGEAASARELQQSPFESYHAADIHFLTVPWIARIDVRAVGTATGDPSVRALDALVDDLARRGGVRVDRAARTSSLASFAEQAASMRSVPPEAQRREHRREQPDERFDPYSRLVGAAESRLRA
ncbi:MAG TPA: hypothetical protein VIM73_04385 [Polyangiaceae bacterium]